MQRLLLLAMMMIGTWLSAQDTMVVQTLTWEDNVRSGTYTFPDDPDQTYEKIIMRYNMRCHDAAIGNGNVGCREWDYSCNTFITDPTRLDSTQLTHPTHIVTGYDGDIFPFTSVPYYTYIQYNQYESTVNTDALSFVELGTGSAPMFASNLFPRSRQQYLYTAEELTAAGITAGPIHAIELEVQTAGGSIPFLRLRMKAVDRDSLNDGTQDINGFQEVYFRNTDFPQTGWTTLPFYQAFDWDGTSDILLEYSHQGTQGEPVAKFGGHQTSVHTGASPTPQEPYYLGLDGNGWMEVPTAALGMDQEVTIAFWTYGLSEVLPANTTIFEAVDGANRRQMNVHLPWSDGNIYWDCGNDGSGYDRISKAANVEDFEGQWTHWAFTKNATTGEMAIYLNGELWHSGTGFNRPIAANQMIVGANASGNWKYPGGLNNFSMWQKALTAEEIQAIMYTEDIPGTHPQANQLILHYPLREGAGLVATDASGNGFNANMIGPNWQVFRGKDLQQNWTTIPYRYNVRWAQGSVSEEVNVIPVIDSTQVYPNTVVEYAVDANNDLIQTGIYETYLATETFLYDEDGNIIDFYFIDPEGQFEIEELTYFRKTPAKFEILSLVTPYGNGLDLGQEGKTFYFDVSDFAPVLRGERFLSMEMGGQNQEEMDIQFWFITGTPTREVLNIENIWPFRRGNYSAIQQDDVFEPRTLELLPEGDTYKLKASVTGHGQNGEFVPRQHYLNVDGGSQDFVFDVWKECGENPIYPQGGTWIFDRAGWCPGAATDIHEYYLPDEVGSSVEIDYGVNGTTLSEANYLVAAQMVTYGPPSFTTDAAIDAIIRPSKRVEFERFNPACNEPTIVLKNNGTEPITAAEILYGVEGGLMATYSWSGNLDFLETTTISIPVTDYHFFETDSEEPTFFAQLQSVNGGTDEYANNDRMESAFTPARVLDEMDLLLQIRTNNRPQENRYTIKDASGNVVLSRDNMSAATTYRDDIILPPGCYTFNFEDDGDDGLDFWYWALVGQNVGTGNLSFRRYANETIVLPVYSLENDHGDGIQVDFIIPGTINSEEVTQAQRLSVYPNPARSLAQVELTGFAGQEGRWQLVDLMGRVLQDHSFRAVGQEYLEELNLTALPAGMYVVRVVTEGRIYTQEIAVLNE